MSAVQPPSPRLSLTPRPLYGDAGLSRWALIQADSLQFLRELPDHSVDVVITDPPYGIGFKGKQWDAGDLLTSDGFQTWTTAWATEALRVLKPGGYLAAFGAARTMHRLVGGVEDAGFEVRDQLLWLFGSGIPKSRRIEPDLGTALKPAYEPILLARAPLVVSLSATRATWGTGVLDLSSTRVQDELEPPPSAPGRWPANIGVIHSQTCEPGACGNDCPRVLLDQQAAAPVSRFFYAAKAARKEREAGLEALTPRAAPVFAGSGARPRANVHPTVKPLSLMRWLVRLLTPPGGLVLDPFAGSGSTGCAALLEQRQFVGIERDPNYIAIARARMEHWAETAAAPVNSAKY